VPANTARLRLTLSAAHTADDLSKLTGALNRLENQLERRLEGRLEAMLGDEAGTE
jgi:hypothetical protein